MHSPGTITIIGGGLAGLTLGIGLRQNGIPVVIREAGTYPRHRVCGEFISGNGPTVLQRLGLLKLLEDAGAIHVHTAAFIAGSNHSPVRNLPAPAIGLSRHSMDAALAKEFQRLGGELHENSRWHPPNQDEPATSSPSLPRSGGLELLGKQRKEFAGGEGPQRAERTGASESLGRGEVALGAQGVGTIRASGRRAQPTEDGWRWFGLKVHATNVTLSADLEMHVSADNYVGVNRIDRGQVNVCGLFRGRPGQTRESGFKLLRGKPGSPLHDRLASARFDENSFCSVAGLSLKPQRATDKSECCIGDAVTMIPPVTGNGMSMAFESAEIAIEPLTRYSRGEMNWPEARDTIARACDAAFAERLTWARRLQRLMFSPLIRTRLGGILLRSDALWMLLFTRTR